MARDGRKNGSIGNKVSLPDVNAFATDAEISARDKTAKQNAPTTFDQFGPSDSGGNIATMDENPQSRSGRMKWSRY